MKIYFILLIFFAVGINFSQACNGYKLRMKKIENCGGPKQVLKIDTNATAKFSNDCKVVLNGCGSTIGFKTANIQYTIKKNGQRVANGNSDVCQELKSDSRGIGTALVSFGLPKNCPIEQTRKCAKGEQIDISKHKNMLALARGTIEINIDGTHDTGKTCINLTIEISR